MPAPIRIHPMYMGRPGLRRLEGLLAKAPAKTPAEKAMHLIRVELHGAVQRAFEAIPPGTVRLSIDKTPTTRGRIDYGYVFEPLDASLPAVTFAVVETPQNPIVPENTTRSKILDLVLACPGIAASEVARRIGIARSAAEDHLYLLQRHGLARKHRVAGAVGYFGSPDLGAEIDPTRILLRSKAAQRVHEAIHRHPGIDLDQLAKETNLERKTIRLHVQRFETAGLVVAQAGAVKRWRAPEVGA